MTTKTLVEIQLSDGLYKTPDGAIIKDPKPVWMPVEVIRIYNQATLESFVWGEALIRGILDDVSYFSVIEREKFGPFYEMLKVQYFR